MRMAAPTCALCGKAPSSRLLSYRTRCDVVRKPVCLPCSRSLELPYPFTLQPLSPPK